VQPRSDRTGYRLTGPGLTFSRRALDKPPDNGSEPTNVINTGYPIGGVNLCGQTPIVLPVDGPSQGGFITPYTVVSAALWKIGQAQPGHVIRFELVSQEQAVALRRALDERASSASIL
jgi:urea carboxylase